MSLEKYDNVMRELQETWETHESLFHEGKQRTEGIRSSQVAALVALLVKHGVFDKEE
jgi:hypothetical protein